MIHQLQLPFRPVAQRSNNALRNDDQLRLALLDSKVERQRSGSCIGAELRIAHRLLCANGSRDGDLQSRLAKADRRVRKLFERPTLEAPLILNWNVVEGWIWSERLLLNFSPALIGERLCRADVAMMGSAGNEVDQCQFLSPNDANVLFAIIADLGRCPMTPLERAAIAFISTVICHPFQDGNGRTARLLAISSLAEAGMIDAPVVPINLGFYLNGPEVARALRRLQEPDDWPYVIDEISKVIIASARLPMMVSDG